MPFDRAAALAEGYTEDEINAYLAQKAQGGAASSTGGGVFKEAAKGAGRGFLGLPNLSRAANEYFGFDSTASPAPAQWAPPAPDYLPQANQALQANPQNNLERMAGTGAEIFTGALTTPGGPAMSAGRRAFNAAVPAAGGVAGEQLGGDTGKLVGTLAAPFGQAGMSHVLGPQLRPGARELINEGVHLTPGQMYGGAMERFEKFPVVREFTANARQRADEEFNVVVMNRALSPIKGKVKDAGFKGFQAADDVADIAYANALRGTNTRYDFQMATDLRKAVMNGRTPELRNNIYETVMHEMSPTLQKYAGQKIPPEEWKAIDSKLGFIYRRFNKSNNPTDQEMADGIFEVQAALRNAVARQNPAKAEPIQNANHAWANLKRVERAVVSAGDNNGVFTAKQFQNAVKALDSSPSKAAFARGRATMQNTSKTGVDILGHDPNPHVPYALLKNMSLLPAAAGAGAALGPAAGAPLAALWGAYNPMTQRALPTLLGKRPEAVQKLGEAVHPRNYRAGLFGAIPGLEDEE